MSAVDTIAADDDLEAEPVQNQFDDIYAELTNSVAKDGQTIMTGVLKLANGSAAAPSATFGSDTDTGFYRLDANTVGLTQGGVVVGPVTAFPAGTVMLFVQAAAPTGWTKGTSHNDKALRIVSGTASSGGTTAFTSVFASRTLATANLPVHDHGNVSGNVNNHVHTGAVGTLTMMTVVTNVTGSGISLTTSSAVANVGTTNSGGDSPAYAAATQSAGSGTAMDFAVQYLDCIYATKD